MGKRKRNLPSTLPSDPLRAEPSPGSSPDKVSVAAYQEGRAWISTTAAMLSSVPGPDARLSLQARRSRQGTLPLIQHRPSIEAYWHARFGLPPFSREQHAEIVRATEFRYAELLLPSVQFAPLYSDLVSTTRQRMIVRTWLRESMGTLIRTGLGPTSVIGPLATRALAWTLTFSAGVLFDIPVSQRQLVDVSSLLSDLQGLIRDGLGVSMARIWREMTGLVVILETTIQMEGIFYPPRPRKSSGGGSSQ